MLPALTADFLRQESEPTPLMKGARIQPVTAVLLLVAFAGLITIPAAHQFLYHRQQLKECWKEFRQEGFPTAETCKRLEDQLARESELAKKVRRWYQGVVTHTLGQGSREVVVGADDFLFYRQPVDFCTGSGFLSASFLRERRAFLSHPDDAFGRLLQWIATGKRVPPPDSPPYAADDTVSVFVDLKNQLRELGIDLIVMAVPNKETIYPEKLWAGYPLEAGPPVNVDYERWKQRLAEGGVEVLDVTDTLWNAKAAAASPLYLRYDTHWSPEAVALASEPLAKRVRQLLGPYQRKTYDAHPEELFLTGGDLRGMLVLTEKELDCLPNRYQTMLLQQDGQGLHAGDEAPVLLLGDSFLGIYDGEGASLAQQLMLRLGAGVQTVDINQEAQASGKDLRDVLAEKPQMLRHKKVVVWEIITRALRGPENAWKKVRITPAGDNADSVPLYQPGERLVLSEESAAAFLEQGWHGAVGEPRWSSQRAGLHFRLEQVQPLRLRMMATTFGRQEVVVRLNGQPVGTWQGRGGPLELLEMDLPPELLAQENRLEFETPAAHSPQSVGQGDDERPLGLRAVWLRLFPPPPSHPRDPDE